LFFTLVRGGMTLDRFPPGPAPDPASWQETPALREAGRTQALGGAGDPKGPKEVAAILRRGGLRVVILSREGLGRNIAMLRIITPKSRSMCYMCSNAQSEFRRKNPQCRFSSWVCNTAAGRNKTGRLFNKTTDESTRRVYLAKKPCEKNTL